MAEDELEPGDTPQTEWLKKNEPETLPSGAKQKSEVPGVIEVVDKVLEVAGKVVTPILATVALADEATEAAEELRQVVGGRKKEAEPGVLSHFEKLQQRILSTSTTKWPLTARTELIKERDEMVRRAQGWGVFTGLGMAVTNVMKSSDWDSVVSDLKQLADARDREMRRRNVDYDGNSDYYGIVEETIVGLARDVQLDGLERMTEEKRAESGVTPQEFENMRQRAEQGRIITLNDGKPKPEEIMNLGLDTGRLVDLNARKEKHRADEQLQEDRRRADEATRVSREEKERQRRHELELEKAKAEAAARGQAGAGGITSFKDLFPAVEYREKAGFTALFIEGGDFVKKYGFPEWLKYSGAGLEAIRRKTVNILTDAIINGAVKPFESIEFINAAGEEFVFAFRSLFAARDRTKAGSWRELTGDADYGIPSALEGLNIKFSLEYLFANEGLRRTVDILMAADGRFWEGDEDSKYTFIGDPNDRQLVKDLIGLGYREWVSIPGSKGVYEKEKKDRGLTISQGQSRKVMDSFSERIAKKLKVGELSIDVGTVYLARELVALMGYGVEFEAIRTMQAKMAKEGSVYSLVAASGDTCLMPFLKKVGIKGDYGLLHKAYQDGGFAKMAEVAKGLKGTELFLWARGMRALTDNLDEIEKMFDPDKKGAALSAKNKEEYLGKVGEFLKKLTEGDPPLMKPETAGAILRVAQRRWGFEEQGTLSRIAAGTPEERIAMAKEKGRKLNPTIKDQIAGFMRIFTG